MSHDQLSANIDAALQLRNSGKTVLAAVPNAPETGNLEADFAVNIDALLPEAGELRQSESAIVVGE